MAKKVTSAEKRRYQRLLKHIFFDSNYGAFKPGMVEIPFELDSIRRAVAELGIDPPKNFADPVYDARYRSGLSQAILDTQPAGQTWVIQGAGKGRYKFQLVTLNVIAPNPNLVAVKIPDATPEIIAAYALSDEQALLAKVRYNRLIDVFMGVVAYSLQNHLRTSVKGVGQIEIDEIYVALDRKGQQFVVPVQAKGGNDKLSVVQTKQDIACCDEKFPDLTCRPVSAQFIGNDLIAMFELTLEDGMVKVAEERHYRLVPASEITPEDLASYRTRGGD
ncbi:MULTISPECIES: hypothetical protein [Roseomonadaceae]|uniref:Endonuclease n=1 Tax=Falsiroseomonas oleicola TaxID=2801474 RepID=A0ABS6H9B4_9PROT|nr:hypothetical protein [Roseomonas oleicola]MBU8545039.1 hypothetical protein [Roseomonas oleicola]